MKCNVILSEKD